MTERIWNEGQRQALETTGRNILVSAAAGSGKTSVLTERVIRHIRDEGCDIREMLIVTFSNAAAAEMKERIYGALMDSARSNVRLLRQAELAADADICTIHSFCSRVIRENFEQAGVAPSNYTLSGGESDLIKEEALEDLFDELYESEDEGFLRLLKRYCGRNDAELKGFIFKLHHYFSSLVDYGRWLDEKNGMQQSKNFLAWLETDFDMQNNLGFDEAARLFGHSSRICAENGFDTMGDIEKENMHRVLEFKELYKSRGREAFKTAWESGSPFVNARFAKMSEDFKEYIKSVREDAKSILQKIVQNNYLLEFQDKVGAEIVHTLPDILELKRIYGAFYEKYASLKKDRNAIDFNDLEHKALLALDYPEVRQKYADKYKYVFIDEYQDTNPVQEEILSRICREKNRFMVGDLKQSIYRFRQADPNIFKAKASAYCTENTEGSLVHMNENFRSFPEIIDFVNYCMGNIMSPALGDIDYSAGEALTAGKKAKGGSISLLLCTNREAAEDESAEEDPSQEWSEAEREAYAVAQKIKEMMSGTVYDEKQGKERTTEYGDIAILLREVKSTGKAMKLVLLSQGIPASVEADATLSDYPEVESFIDLLRIVDNFRQDIPLLSVMRSGFGGFMPDELADIRINRNDKDTPFYEAVKIYAAERDDALGGKLISFLDKIKKLRLMSRSMRVGEFLLAAERETGFGVNLVSLKDGENKYLSLAGILENAGQAGKAASESLYAFIKYIDDMLRTDRLSELLKPQSGKNAVRIMSIHKSKGLEFPIVFLSRLNKRFNTSDTKQNMLICRDMGIAVKYTDEKKLLRRDTYLRQKAQENIRGASLSEELRILYVALTRTKQHLVLSASIRKLRPAVLRWMKPKSPFALSKCSAYLEWLMPLIIKFNGAEAILAQADLDGFNPDKTEAMCIKAEFASEVPPVTTMAREREELLAGYLEHLPGNALLDLSFAYPYEKDLLVPAKRSVTSIKKEASKEVAFTRPAVEEEEPGNFTASQRGTITHYVMRYIDLNPNGDIQRTLKRLAEKKLLSEEEILAVNTDWVASFLQSVIAKRIGQSKKVFRELPFCLAMDAGELGYAGSDEKVIIQGVIDLCFEEAGKWVILDYKTDRVDEKTVQLAAIGYKKQLELYAEALEKITHIPVAQKFLYFFHGGMLQEV